jgi:hypothetical protein
MASPATFHMPGGAFHAHPRSTTPEGSPRVHPGLFRPPPQSPGSSASNSLFFGPSTNGNNSGGSSNITFGPFLHQQEQQNFFQQQVQDQPRRQINTAIIRAPERPPLVSSPSTKRKRGIDGVIFEDTASPFDGSRPSTLLGNEWIAADSTLASPVLGPVVTSTHAYSGGMGGGLSGFDLGRRHGGGDAFNPFNPFNPFGKSADGPLGLDDGINLVDSTHSDVDYRRTGGSSRPESRDADGDVCTEKPPVEHIPDGPQQMQAGNGWFTLNTLGGVIGKVLNFCTAGAFKGFYAGGGRGFNIESDGTVMPVERVECVPDQHEHHQQQQFESKPEQTMYDGRHDELSPIHQDWPPPGFFPTEIKTPVEPEPEIEPAPAPKRRQVSEANDELRNWVMVPEPECQRNGGVDGATATGASPSASLGFRRTRINPAIRRATASQSSALPRRQYPKALHTPRPSFAGSTFGLDREPASFASFAPTRSPERVASPAPSTPSRIPISAHASPHISAHTSSIPRPKPISQIPTRPSSSASSVATMTGLPIFQQKPAPSPSHLAPHHTQTHRRNGSSASLATPRRPSLTPSMAPSTPAGANTSTGSGGMYGGSPHLTPEARQLARQRAQAEHDADTRMETMNAQLEEMIRLGREALGSSIEIVDEGWMDED